MVNTCEFIDGIIATLIDLGAGTAATVDIITITEVADCPVLTSVAASSTCLSSQFRDSVTQDYYLLYICYLFLHFASSKCILEVGRPVVTQSILGFVRKVMPFPSAMRAIIHLYHRIESLLRPFRSGTRPCN